MRRLSWCKTRFYPFLHCISIFNNVCSFIFRCIGIRHDSVAINKSLSRFVNKSSRVASCISTEVFLGKISKKKRNKKKKRKSNQKKKRREKWQKKKKKRRRKGESKNITSQSSIHESCTEITKRTRKRFLFSIRKRKRLSLYLDPWIFDKNQ